MGAERSGLPTFEDRLKDILRQKIDPQTWAVLARVYRSMKRKDAVSFIPRVETVDIAGQQIKFKVSGPGELDRITNLKGERSYIDYIISHLQDSTHVADVGAHIGTHTLAFALANPNATIYSIEPEKTIFERLCENIRLNNLANIVPLNCAVGNFDGQVSIVTDGIEGMAPRIVSGTETQATSNHRQAVDCFSLATMAASGLIQKPDAIKVDVESNEVEVLLGMGVLRPKNLFIEVHLAMGVSLEQVTNQLATMNYTMEWSLQRDDEMLTHFTLN